jgi:hypothetical protein
VTLILIMVALASTPIRLQHPADPVSLSLHEVASTLREAHVEVFGQAPSRHRLALAVGQVRLEGLALPGRNLGGLEYVPGLPWVQVDRVTRLRAFDSYPEAARAYWSHLGRVCRGALAMMDWGTPEEVASALRRCGWYRAPVAWYQAGLRALAR